MSLFTGLFKQPAGSLDSFRMRQPELLHEHGNMSIGLHAVYNLIEALRSSVAPLLAEPRIRSNSAKEFFH